MNNELCKHLNSYLFSTVWNSPLKEFRRNIHPLMLGNRSVRGVYSDPLNQVKLPIPSNSYYLYAIDKTVIGKDISPAEWVTVASFIGDGRLSLRFHSDTGHLLYRDQVWLKESDNGRVLYIAVNKDMFITVTDNNPTFDPSELYMVVYYDSNIENDTVREYAVLETDLLRSQFFDKATHPSTSRVFLNGKEAQLTDPSELLIGSRIEVITDANVFCSFELDLTLDEDILEYISETDGNIKQIVHIPKALNPDNRVITHNTCDIYVRPKNGGIGNNLKGRLLHRCQIDNPIVQLTHNDFAIPTVILDAYRTSIGSSDILLYVECKHHGNDQFLLREKMYIDLLYTQTDIEIGKFLIDEGDRTLPFWTASALENCPYTKMLFDVPEYVTTENVDKYVDIFGYNRILSFIGPRVQGYSKTAELKREFLVSIPLIFQGKTLSANVFIDGLKVPNSLITTSLSTVSEMLVVVDPSQPWPEVGDVIVEFFESPDVPVYKFTPTDGNMSIELSYSNFRIYQENTGGAEYVGINKVSNKTHTYVPISSGVAISVTTGNITLVTFSAPAKDNTYHIQCDHGSLAIEQDLEPMIAGIEPLTIDLELVTEDQVTVVPLLGPKATIVYLNGRELVQDVDYKQLTLETGVGDESFSQILIQNMEYLKEVGNVAEVHIVRDAIINRKDGFIGDTIIRDPEIATTWLDGLSVAIVDGLLIKDISILGNGMVIGDFVPRLGAFYGVRTVIPLTSQEYLDGYSTDEDTARVTLINTYLTSIPNVAADIELLEYSHRIYSVFLHMIVRDILKGNFTLGYEPDPKLVLSHVEVYEYLKAFDAVYQAGINFDFIDAYPTYQNHNIVDMVQYRGIQQLVSAALPPDAVRHGDVVS